MEGKRLRSDEAGEEYRCPKCARSFGGDAAAVVRHCEGECGAQQWESSGGDDCCIEGVVDSVTALLSIHGSTNNGSAIKSAVFCLPSVRCFYGDSNWGCGYRNTQTQCGVAAQLSDAHSYLLLPPSVAHLQTLMVRAWRSGFDVVSARALGWEALQGSKKWIGVPECASLLRSLGIRAFVADFHNHTHGAPNAARRASLKPAFDFVRHWFEEEAQQRPPLMLQWKGHSVTIIGCGVVDGKRTFIIFDPNLMKPKVFNAFIKKKKRAPFMLTEDDLCRKPEFQMLGIHAGTIQGAEFEQSKEFGRILHRRFDLIE